MTEPKWIVKLKDGTVQEFEYPHWSIDVGCNAVDCVTATNNFGESVVFPIVTVDSAQFVTRTNPSPPIDYEGAWKELREWALSELRDESLYHELMAIIDRRMKRPTSDYKVKFDALVDDLYLFSNRVLREAGYKDGLIDLITKHTGAKEE